MNKLVRGSQMLTPAQQQMPQQQGQWVWDGQGWTCGCDDGSGSGPPGPWFPPPGNMPPWYPGANGGVSFSQTPPPNPIRGHFWWDGATLWLFDGAAWVDSSGGGIYGGGGGGGSSSSGGGAIISSTPPGNPAPGTQWWNGSQMHVWDGSQWNVVGPGSTVGPVPTTTITFAIAQSATMTGMSTTAWTIMPFTGTPQVDTMSGFDQVSMRYKPNKPGIYQFLIRAYANAASGGTVGIALLKNDTGSFTAATDNVIALTDLGSGTSLGEWMSTVGVTVMNGTTDFVRMFGYAGSSGTMYGFGNNPIFTSMLLP